jgi:hypothetical protein
MQRSASNLKVRFIKRDIHILIVSKRLKILKATSNNGYYSDHQDEINTYIERNRIPDTRIDGRIRQADE